MDYFLRVLGLAVGLGLFAPPMGAEQIQGSGSGLTPGASAPVPHAGALIVKAAGTPAWADAVLMDLDTIPVDPDTIPLDPDTIPAAPPVPDTVPEEVVDPEDEPVVVRNLPAVPRPVPPGWETGVWEWDREGLLSTRAINLAELLQEVPGVTPIRAGDFGAPTTVTASGLGPGRIRVFLDGAELAPLDGGVVDLARVALVGLDRVRVLRRPGELRIELIGLQVVDPRPMSLLEVGTGDLQTNLFRGTFVHPTALGGNVVVALDRIDTEGPQREEEGASFGAHLRHTLFRGDRGGVAWEFRRMTSRRPDGLFVPEDIVRTDWNVRGRYQVWGDAVVDVFYHRSSLGVDEDRDGEGADTLITADARSQIGVRLAVDRGAWWAEGELRRHGGPGWPESAQALRGGTVLAGWLGASAEVERQAWDGASGVTVHGRMWTNPFLGVSLYAEAESGRRAVPAFVPAPRPVEEDPDPDPDPDPDGDPEEGPNEDEPDDEVRIPARFTDLQGYRVGAEFRRGGLFLGAAALAVDPDSLHPMGLGFDRDGPSLVGGRRTGVEIAGSIPLTPVLDGLSIQGASQFWTDMPAWPYAPERTYQARMRYHNVFLETRNLEVWGDVGVHGRDGMAVPILDADEVLGRVPSSQSWFARVQVRVVSVRVFVHWENFTLRDDNQDLPGRVLPQTRAMYGIRWTLWN